MNTSSIIFSMGIAWAGFGIAIPTVLKITPDLDTASIFDVNAVRVERNGTGADLFVDRDITAPIHMKYSVRIMEATPQGWTQFCIARGPTTLYLPENIIPQPVSLGWWTNDICPALPEGQARIITTWEPSSPNMRPLSWVADVEPEEPKETQ